jgi:hypothetical protein
MSLSIESLLLFIGAALLAFVIFAGPIAEQWNFVIGGLCWGQNARSAVKEIREDFLRLTRGETAEKTVTLGNCVGYILFVDGDRIDRIYEGFGVDAASVIKCPAGYGTYILAIPYLDNPDAQIGLNPEDTGKAIENIYSKAKMQPFCDVIGDCRDCSYATQEGERMIMGPLVNGGSAKWCVRMSKAGITTAEGGNAGERYSITVSKGVCS